MTMTSIPAAPQEHLVVKERPYNMPARIMSRVVMTLCYSSAILTISALGLIFGYVLYQGFSSLNLDFFRLLPGPPGDRSGMANCITGTIVLIGMASTVGVPVGMLCGIYLSEYARENWFSHILRTVVDVLAGVPSIVVGVLGYELVVVPMKINSAWAGACALAFMMCPIVARTTEEMLRLVPPAYREASVGVGASKFQTLFRVVLPAARNGIITGVMLAVARVAGETAPLLFTALASDQPVIAYSKSFPWIYMDVNHPFPSLTVQIFKYASSGEPDWIRQAWAGMLVLITIVLVLNMAVRYVSRNKHVKAKA